VLSRLLVWTAGMLAYGIIGTDDPRVPHFGAVGDLFAAPIARWDTVHLQDIALHGYERERLTAFFPLYPLLARGAGELTGSLLFGGALVSLIAFFVALVLLYRLAELDLGADVARRTVYLVAFFPAALFFSAFYSESLFLALTVGALYAARTGHWGPACALGALAAATRNTGVLVAVPIALLYLYGPRADRTPSLGVRARRLAAGLARPHERLVLALRPRYPLRADALWIGLVPLGLIAYGSYTWARFGDPLATFQAQTFWTREFSGPFSAIYFSIGETTGAVGELFLGGSHDTFESPAAKLALFCCLIFAFVAIAGMARRLPVAYTAYTFLAIIPPLSSPIPEHPLTSLPRYLAVLFPVHMWLALQADTPRRFGVVVAVSAGMLVFLTGKFVTWEFAG